MLLINPRHRHHETGGCPQRPLQQGMGHYCRNPESPEMSAQQNEEKEQRVGGRKDDEEKDMKKTKILQYTMPLSVFQKINMCAY